MIDTLGTVGNAVVGVIAKVPFLAEHAATIYVTLIAGFGWLLTRLLQSFLKGLPTKWYLNEATKTLAVGLFWKLMSWIFGKSILFYNVKVETPEEKALALAKTREHFLKHDPVLSIKVKDLMK